MVSDETYAPAQPPFLATFVSIWVGGFVASAVVRALPLAAAPHSWAVESVYRLLLAAVVGGVVLGAVLPRLAGAEISYAGATFAFAAGGALGTAVQLVWLRETARHLAAAGPWLTTVSAAGSLVAAVAALAGTIVTYQVVVTLAEPAGASGGRGMHELALPEEISPLPEPRRELPVRTWLDVAVADVRRAVVTACNEIGTASAIEVPSRVLEALTELGTCTRTVRLGELDDPQVRKAVEQLVGGLERFQATLADLGTPAIEGARLRYELEHADGLAQIRAALERIDELRVANAT